MAAGLITEDTIRLKTDIGICQIELCVGDITKLQEKVDVLVVSAFPGDYSTTPSSLIGQLQIQLGLSVRNLSKNKEEDLRKQYFCWWSKPLADHLNYKRLLCFEGGFGARGTRPPKVIGAVFRCLVPVLNNKEGSVIMPLLSSGDQGFSEKLVLRQVLNAAVNWMKAGLPLRTLKIVLFSRQPEKKNKMHEPLIQFFKEFKNKVEYKDIEEIEKDTIILYDIYISHCPTDHGTAMQIKEFLLEKKDLKVFHDIQELNDNESWQDDIYNIMAKCSRVVTLLSPGYLASESCIEQYNIALCISRRKHKEVLAPFYVSSVEYLPTYMGLMQYIDCRPRDVDKLKDAILSINQWLEMNNIESIQAESTATTTQQSTVLKDYDVFISYSHCNKAKAFDVLEALKIHDPDLEVFIDTSGLNTGTSWQQTLYHAIDKSKVMIALLSPDYIESKVCKEEFSLALALHLDHDRDFKLVSLLINEVKKLPEWCHKPHPVDCASEDVNVLQIFARVAKSITTSTGEFDLELEKRLNSLTGVETASIDEFTQRYRKIQLLMRKNLLGKPVSIVGKQPDAIQSSEAVLASETDSTATAVQPESRSTANTCDVALSYAEEDAKAAVTMKQLLLEQSPSLKISEPRTNASSRLMSLDVAQVIVILLSPAYMNSKELVEELNIALYRHRFTPLQIVYPIQVSPLPPKPTYIHLLPCDFAAMDYVWMLRALSGQMSHDRIDHLARDNDISSGVASCLLDASDVIIKRLSNPEEHEEHTQVLLNNLEVQKIWHELREELQKEQGLYDLKTVFDVELVTDLDGAKREAAESNEPALLIKTTMLKEMPLTKPEGNKELAENEGRNQNSNPAEKSKDSSPKSTQERTRGSYDLQKAEIKNKSKSCTVV